APRRPAVRGRRPGSPSQGWTGERGPPVSTVRAPAPPRASAGGPGFPKPDRRSLPSSQVHGTVRMVRAVQPQEPVMWISDFASDDAIVPLVVFCIPIVAIVGGITAGIVRTISRHRLIELAQR